MFGLSSGSVLVLVWFYFSSVEKNKSIKKFKSLSLIYGNNKQSEIKNSLLQKFKIQIKHLTDKNQ